MYRLIFTDTELADIIKMHKAGISQCGIAKKFYCSATTIGVLLRQNGIFGKRGSIYPVEMIKHDLMAGAKAADIVKKYRLPRPHIVYNIKARMDWRHEI